MLKFKLQLKLLLKKQLIQQLKKKHSSTSLTIFETNSLYKGSDIFIGAFLLSERRFGWIKRMLWIAEEFDFKSF